MGNFMLMNEPWYNWAILFCLFFASAAFMAWMLKSI